MQKATHSQNFSEHLALDMRIMFVLWILYYGSQIGIPCQQNRAKSDPLDLCRYVDVSYVSL
jgi:hypothetical protein